MKKTKAFLLLCIIGYLAAAQPRDTNFIESPIKVAVENGESAGTLTLPGVRGGPVALIISGSGPTDRNGNSIFSQNNALRMLAHELTNMGIASVRYDKRGIGESAKLMKKESDLRFEDYINDAVAWVHLLKKDERFSSVTIVGHSEGSLIGMVAAFRAGADKFVSVAGPGRPIDVTLKEQLKTGNAELYDLAVPVLDSLKMGLTVKNIDRKLMMYFRPGVQPYMISWIKYDPPAEIKKLKIPVLIVQGTKDLQVPVSDAALLYTSARSPQRVLIENMNHVLKLVEGDREANEKTYHEPARLLAPTLAFTIGSFIGKK
jgi:uncharacterized protein